MISKTIKFKDFDGNEVEETHYFHLSETDLMELEMSADGGLGEHMKRVVEAGKPKEILALFKMLLLAAYGERTDATHFRKSEELRKLFESSLAYNNLYMELATDAEAGAAFVNGLITEDVRKRVVELAEISKEEG